MNREQWLMLARPVMLDTLAVLGEFMDDPRPQDFPALRGRLRAAGRRRDVAALRRVSEELKAEARRRLRARVGRERREAA